MQWTKWKDYQGVRSMGENRYNPKQPWGPWTKIMGVVARCEGNHDTCVSYDNTGMTWGFLQWTFTSGRLQKLLQHMKSIAYYDFDNEDEGLEESTLFDQVFCDENGSQIFNKFGFHIKEGHFWEIKDSGELEKLSPRVKKEKQRISDICMGKVRYKKFTSQKKFAKDLAQVFSEAGKREDVAIAQIEFGKNEFKRCLNVKRKPLKNVKTIGNLLEGTWDTPIPAIFFNLWQNSPAGAYRLFLNEYKLTGNKGAVKFLEGIWSRLSRSKYANWSYAKPENKSPRIRRIKRALLEFYDFDLPLVRY